MTDKMRIEHIVSAHPETADIFKAFQIDRGTQGDRTLKQLGQSRDLDMEALVLALDQSVGGRDLRVPVPELLWDSSCDGMMLIDAHRRVLAINPTLERWIGRPARAVVGRSECGALFACRDLRGDLLWDHADRCPGLRAIHRLKAVTEAEYTIHTASGARLPASASYTPIQLHPGGPVWALVVMRDARLQKRREQELVRQAAADPLTGLPNRRQFLEACGRELAQAVRHDRPLAVALADVCGFTQYNETYGPPAGDELLKALAAVLRTGLRAGELVARYGGDEFVILMPQTDATGAMTLARRLCRMIEQFPFVRIGGNGHASLPGRSESSARGASPVALTIGVAVFPGDGRTAEALLVQADRRLCDATQGGRNRVAGPPVHTSERRRHRRVELETPVLIRSLEEGPDAFWHKGKTKNLGLGGVLCALLQWKPLTVGEVLEFSIPIPPERQRGFPFSHLAGRARVMRIEELAPRRESGQQPLQLALAFSQDLTALATVS